jgi:hypothetical protein
MQRWVQVVLLWFFISSGLRGVEPAFDLVGPKVDVHVKREDVTLPIGEVPYLLPGDRIWIHPDLPESQSTHYVLIVAFLRGATNPPPLEWFARVETWTRAVQSEGVFVTVPTEAQQAVMFLAPETGGDFSTLRTAVRGRPGAFVRATQDLQAASLDRMRLDAYLAEVKNTSQSDPGQLKERTELAARSLGIKLDQQCFDKPSEQQAPCLVQHTEGLVLDDANAQSLVVQLTSGSTADLMNHLGSTNMMGGGAYSPYFGAIVDTARILSTLHTAHFQYIPALALPTKDTMNLRLNVPPSFRDPKSVVVIALPPVGVFKPQPLHALNPSEGFCIQAPGLVLPTEGAPLFFATQLTHSPMLRIDIKGKAVELPLKADPSQGGLVLANPAPLLPGAEGELTGVVHGKWGFDDWEGPRFHLRTAEAGKWAVAAGDQSALVVGREDLVHIAGESAECVDKLQLQTGSGAPVKLAWRALGPGTLEVVIPLKDAAPGAMTLEIHEFGEEKPDKLVLNAYAEAASLDRLTISPGDTEAQLKGTRLDEVARAEMNGIAWTPAGLTRVQDLDQLTLTTQGSTANLEPGKHYVARVQLLDGRQLKVQATVEPPRPQVTLLNKGTQEDPAATPSLVRLGSTDDFPLDWRLVFFLKARVPAAFSRDEKVEVAAADGSFRTVLSIADGSLILEDSKTAMGAVEPLARFGASAFGPVRLRVMAADGATGDWLPLGTLVRLPGFKELRCQHATAKTCTLSGTNLFLTASVAATQDFDNAIDVPPDFTGTQLTVPHPANGVLYVKLRDDPATVQSLNLPVTLPAPPAPMTASQQGQPAAAPATSPAKPER